MMVSRRDGRRKNAGAARPGPADAPVSGPSGTTPAAPGWPDPAPERFGWIVPKLERKAASQAEVVLFWQKAIAKAKVVPGLSPDTAVDAAYSAGRIACVAVLASRHIRVRSQTGHHELTFHAVAALDLPGCDDLVAESEVVRQMRALADYHEVAATPEDLHEAVAWLRRTLPVLRAALVAHDPDMARHIAEVP